MTFDSHSLERLRELGRKLPKVISKSEPKESKESLGTNKKKLHPVEIETNPEQLFRELMEISPDGNVPSHLLDRLKKLESNNIKITPNTAQGMNKVSEEPILNESQLYAEFKQFLLDDEVN